MDSSTHAVMGIGLAGLSTLDPTIDHHSTLFTAILIGTALGSQAPDFDIIVKLRGKNSYIRHHRGISHSIPFIVLWSVLITLLVQTIFSLGESIGTLFFWVTTAVTVHVFVDLFNSYGTQALRPFSKKWVAWHTIPIFDPYLFSIHVLAIFMWVLGFVEPQLIFPIMYGVIVGYYIIRMTIRKMAIGRLRITDPHFSAHTDYLLLPTISLRKWRVIKKITGQFLIGELNRDVLDWEDRAICMDHPIIELSRHNAGVAAFLSFSTFACPQIETYRWGYEVRWRDLRYYHRKQYPFVAVVRYDKKLHEIEHFMGWLNDARLAKKLQKDVSR